MLMVRLSRSGTANRILEAKEKERNLEKEREKDKAKGKEPARKRAKRYVPIFHPIDVPCIL